MTPGAQVDLILGSGLFEYRWYLERYPDVRGSDAALHYVLRGAAEGRDPGPGFSTGWYLDTYPDVAAEGLNPLVHYVLYGRAEDRSIVDPDRVGARTDDAAGPGANGRGAASPTQWLRIGGDVLGPWSAASRDRWGAVAAFAAAHRGHRPAVSTEGDASPVVFDPHAAEVAPPFAIVGAQLGRGGAVLDDARFDDAGTLALALSGQGLAGEAYQFAGGALVRVGNIAAAGEDGRRRWTIALADPLFPVLLVQRDDRGTLVDAAALVFPSLLPGGLHGDEARALLALRTPRNDLGRALALHHLTTPGARVARLAGSVSSAIEGWFDAVFGGGGGATLRLADATVPCIAALTAGVRVAGDVAEDAEEAGVGWIATTGDGTARVTIVPPLGSGDAPATLDPPTALAVPLAIQRPRTTAATPPGRDLEDAGGVTVIVDRDDAIDAAPLLESIAAQTGAAAIEVVLLGDAPPPAVPAPLAGRVRTGAWPDATRAIVVAVDAAVRLPDPATLGVLAALLADGSVAAASCLQATAARPGIGVGGHGPVALALDSRPGVVVREVALPLGALPPTLPMLALSHRLIAVRREQAAGLRAAAGLDGALLFGVEAIEAGGVNLLATGVVALTVLAPDLSERVDPLPPGVLPPERVAALLDRIAVVTPV